VLAGGAGAHLDAKGEPVGHGAKALLGEHGAAIELGEELEETAGVLGEVDGGGGELVGERIEGGVLIDHESR